jgi:L-threonylcarbamoyladenylate synthase
MPLLSGHAPADIAAAAAHLAAGELVAFPTETVYGLGARADSDTAVARIFAAKGRPADHPLIVHLADAADWPAFALEPGRAARRLMAAFWPGPLTLIVPRRPGAAGAAAGGQGSIGLRVPAHPVAQALLRAAAAAGVPGVAAPSANRFGRVSPTTAAHVQQEFGPALWVLDGGACSVGIESAIVDCTADPPALLRPGQLPRARLAQVLQAALAGRHAASPRASGTLEAHYAPAVPLRLFDAPRADGSAAGAAPWAGAAGSAGVYSRREPPRVWQLPGLVWRAMPADADAAARELFAVLRDLEQAGVAGIWVERPQRSERLGGTVCAPPVRSAAPPSLCAVRFPRSPDVPQQPCRPPPAPRAFRGPDGHRGPACRVRRRHHAVRALCRRARVRLR